jgi:hypothetical protein
MEHQEVTDERLSKAEQQLAVTLKRSTMEHQEIVDERLNKAEQHLAEATDELTRLLIN